MTASTTRVAPVLRRLGVGCPLVSRSGCNEQFSSASSTEHILSLPPDLFINVDSQCMRRCEGIEVCRPQVKIELCYLGAVPKVIQRSSSRSCETLALSICWNRVTICMVCSKQLPNLATSQTPLRICATSQLPKQKTSGLILYFFTSGTLFQAAYDCIYHTWASIGQTSLTLYIGLTWQKRTCPHDHFRHLPLYVEMMAARGLPRYSANRIMVR